MNEFNQQRVSEIVVRAAYAEDALRPGGVLHDIAETVVTEPIELAPVEAGNVLLPPKQPGQANEARWQLIDGAQDIVKAGATANAERIYGLADTLDMRHPESISGIDLVRIDREAAVFAIEGGANKTSVVRRDIAINTVRALYGTEADRVTMFQFGSDRQIPRERGGKENPEYKIATQIAEHNLPEGDDLTEFDLNVASALESGYETEYEERDGEDAERVVVLHRAGSPTIMLLQPYKQPDGKSRGLEDGFDALSNVISLNERQLVIATNGQYRPKDEFQAARWAGERGLSMHEPVAIGDEAGYTVRHNGQDIVTGPRREMAYVNEAVILQRLVNQEPGRM